MSKYRSLINYLQIYQGDKNGYNLGLDGQVFIRQESARGVFTAPRIGTQGVSVSAASPATDISGDTTPQLKIALRGAAPLNVTLTPGTNNTGILVAAELERAINAALAAAGSDNRVWCAYTSSLYHIFDQGTGTASTIIITAGTANDCTAALKLGTGNAGTETAGTDDQDALLFTTGGPKFSQPTEPNKHRNGRFQGGFVKKKKVATFELNTYVNMSGTAGNVIDQAVLLMLQSVMGTYTPNGSISQTFTQGLPNVYMTMVRCSTILGEYFVGGYTKGMTLSFPGDGPATVKYSGMAEKASRAGIAKMSGPLSGAALVTLQSNDEAKRYTAGAKVMCVDGTDGRTIKWGADGTVGILSTTVNSAQVTLDTNETAVDGDLLVPWNPGAVQYTVRNAIFTDLEGSFKFNSGDASPSDMTSLELDIQNDHVDLNNRFGADSNRGFVAGNRMTAKLSATFDLSNESYGAVVYSEQFQGFSPVVTLGGVGSGLELQITAPRWVPDMPAIDLPENGTTPVTLSGILYESVTGARDPLALTFKAGS